MYCAQLLGRKILGLFLGHMLETTEWQFGESEGGFGRPEKIRPMETVHITYKPRLHVRIKP